MKTERDLKSEDARLERSSVSPEARAKIREFLTDIRINNAGYDRIIYYAVRLRQLAEMMGSSFLNPSEEDIRKTLATLMEVKIGKTNTSVGQYSESAIQAFKIAMRVFYVWLLGEDTPVIRRLKVGARANRGKKPPQPLTEDAVATMANATPNQRDRTLIWLLYDSGCRVGELLTLRIQDVKFDENGILLLVNGKTGFRQVRVVGQSIVEMQKWIAQYPEKRNESSWVFPVIQGGNMEKHLEETNVRHILKLACRRAGITYRVYAHLFRHTRATLLAQNVAQAPLSKQMGWTQASQMAKVYVHLSDRQQDEAILKGYEKDKEKKRKEP
jgi:integrase